MRDRATARAHLPPVGRCRLPAFLALRAGMTGLVFWTLTGCAIFSSEPEDQTQSTEERCTENLSQRSYRYLDLSLCDLSGWNFDNADFTGANLRGAKIERAQFRHATLIGARLGFIHAVGVDFTGADFTGAEMERFGSSGSKFSGATMVKANLDSAGFGGTTLKDVDFTAASIRNAMFDESTIWGSVFDDADLTGTRFHTSIEGSFLHATCPDGEVSPVSSPEFCKQHKVREKNRRKPKKTADSLSRERAGSK
jgi:uncharacterized protein YjbI with pentapeptide repeats